MKKIFLTLIIGMLLIMLSGVFAQTSDFSEEFEGFIGDIIEQRGINETNIINISRVDFNNLPDEVNLQNIDDTSLGIYQVDFETGPSVYIITMTDTVFKKTISAVPDLKRSYLNFGHSGKMASSGFLKTATEVTTSLEKGYVMVREGSITGISTNLEVTKADATGQIDVIIYRNGQAVGFGNTLQTSLLEVKTDHDTQSEGIITFVAGDIISVYVDAQGNVDWSDVITLIEITSES